MTRPAAPDSTAASCSLRPLPLRLPVSHATCTPSGSSHSTSFLKCCSARISVGAINAHCQPASMAIVAASAATTVLPEPTSPCSRRCIGAPAARVGGDLFGDAALRGGQRKRQHGQQLLVKSRLSGARGAQHRRAQLRALALRRQLRQLLRQQLVELQALPRRVAALVERGQRRARRRLMQKVHRVAQDRQALRQRARRQQFLQRRARQRRRDRLAQIGLRQLRARRIDGRQRRWAAARRPARPSGAPSRGRENRRATRRARAPAGRRRAASVATDKSSESAAPAIRRRRRSRGRRAGGAAGIRRDSRQRLLPAVACCPRAHRASGRVGSRLHSAAARAAPDRCRVSARACASRVVGPTSP